MEECKSGYDPNWSGLHKHYRKFTHRQGDPKYKLTMFRSPWRLLVLPLASESLARLVMLHVPEVRWQRRGASGECFVTL